MTNRTENHRSISRTEERAKGPEVAIQDRLNVYINQSLINSEKSADGKNDISSKEADMILGLLDAKNDITSSTRARWGQLRIEVQKNLAKDLGVDQGSAHESGKIVDALKKRAIDNTSQEAGMAANATLAAQAPSTVNDTQITPGNQPGLVSVVTPAIAAEQKSSTPTRIRTKKEQAHDVAMDTNLLNDSDPQKALQARLAFLSDLDGMSGVESKNKLLGRGDQKYIVGEKQLYNVLTHSIKNSADLTALLGRFGITESFDEASREQTRNDFRDKALGRTNTVACLSSIVLGDKNASSGLIAVIEGKEDLFLNSLVKNSKDIQKIQTEIDNDSALGMQVLSTLLSIGVGIASLGRLHVSLEHRDLGEGHPLALIAGDSANFTAKLRMFDAAVQGNVNDQETGIIKETLGFADILKKSIASTEMISFPADMKIVTEQMRDTAKFYNESKDTLPSWSDQALIDELSRQYMLARAKQENLNFKGIEAGAGLFSRGAYFGLVGQSFDSRIQTVGANSATLAESRLNSTKKELKDLGIESIKDGTGRKYTFLNISPDVIPAELIQLGARNEESKVVLVSPKPLDFHKETIFLADGSTEEYLTITESKTGAKIVLVSIPSPSQTAKSQDVQAQRNLEQHDTMAGSIYKMGRDKVHFKHFDTILTQIADQDYVRAEKWLRDMAKYSKVAKHIVARIDADTSNRDAILQSVTTYTYGGDTKNALSLNQKGYKDSRKKGIVRAEDRLSKASVNPAAEKFFQSEVRKFEPKNLKDVIPGQALSVSVYATPKGGTHRIDKYEGSIQVGSTIYSESISDSQKDHILSSHATEIDKQFKAANEYLSSVKAGVQISKDQYTSILKTGKLPPELKRAGVSIPTTPKFFEARAMIQGNVCMNKTEGLAYPLFGFVSAAPQAAAPVVDMEATEWFGAPTALEKPTVTESGVGVGLTTSESQDQGSYTRGDEGKPGVNVVAKPVNLF